MRRILNKKTTPATDVQQQKTSRLTLSILALSILTAFPAVSNAAENDSDFESVFLRKDKNGATPDIFLYKNAIAPGMKRVELVINDRLTDVYDVDFVRDEKKKIVVPCFNRSLLQDAGVKTELYDDWQTPLKGTVTSEDKMACDVLEDRIPMANVFYDDARQQIRLTLPQEAVNSTRFQMISPQEWDDGTPSLRTSYNGYFYHTRQKNSGSEGGRNINNSGFVSHTTQNTTTQHTTPHQNTTQRT